MDKLSQSQRERVAWFIKEISNVQDIVWDAFETSLMSDAKFYVYQLCSVAENDTELPETFKNTLCAILNEAKSLLGIHGTTEERSLRVHAKLSEAKRYLTNIVMQS